MHRHILVAAVLATTTSLSAPSLRPMKDVLQRMEFDYGIDSDAFEFFYREAQKPVREGCRWGDANGKINGTERFLVKALPQHRFAFVSYGDRLVWHRERRVDRIFGSGFTPDTRYGDVVAERDAWTARRKAAAAATVARIGDTLDEARFDALKRASRAARRRALSPDAWLDAADAILPAAGDVADLVVSLPDVALREAIADALDARGRPLDARLWLDDF